ncbi:PRKG1 [Symbiodinium sp. CCMP2592]|nr:PRKG1 [Symbiodinium sp. CCMP2592]
MSEGISRGFAAYLDIEDWRLTSHDCLEEKLATEKMLLNMTDSSFITRLHATHLDAQFMYLILEPALGGSLKEVYERESFHDMIHVVKYHTAGIALAIGHLHERQICHRDLKPDNILLNEKGHIKVCDLGLAKRFFEKTATFCGTALYMAPEIHAGRWYTHAVDWWSFGVIVYELLSGRNPFVAPTQGQIRASVMKGIRNFGSMQPDCVDFIRVACAARPPLERLKAMRWYRDVPWGRIQRGDVPASWVPKRQPLAGPRSFPRHLFVQHSG